MLYWTGAMVRVDTVALPAIRAPVAPRSGATANQRLLKLADNVSAIYSGIDASPGVLTPELVNIWIIIRVGIKADSAITVDFTAEPTGFRAAFGESLTIVIATSAPISSANPGE